MELPNNPVLPLFAYGALQPGELSYFRVKPFVEKAELCKTRGSVFVRDGLLVADERGDSKIEGYLLRFRPETCDQAYLAVCDLEPSKQYRWGTIDAGTVKANILWGVSPATGTPLGMV